MTKIYHLASCSTCVRIIKELNPKPEDVLQNIKTDKRDAIIMKKNCVIKFIMLQFIFRISMTNINDKHRACLSLINDSLIL